MWELWRESSGGSLAVKVRNDGCDGNYWSDSRKR